MNYIRINSANMDTTPPVSLRRSPSGRPTGGPTRRKNGARYSRFCFTLNNWTQEEYEDLTSRQVKWMVIGKEVGDNGTPHLQGCVFDRFQTCNCSICLQ